MSEHVRSAGCRPSGNRSRRWITLMMIVAMFSFAGLVFAASGNPITSSGPRIIVVNDDDTTTPAGDTLAPSATLAVPVPANDTCSGAIPLVEDRMFYATTVGAANDYTTPATAACYFGLPGTQTPTTAPGRDVVFSFTPLTTDVYSFRMVLRDALSNSNTQNEVLYVASDCPPSGTPTCIRGANRQQASSAFVSSTGVNNNHGEEVSCIPLTAGVTVYVYVDDGKLNNPGLAHEGLEVYKCKHEVEQNGTPATANPYVCNITAASDMGSTAHCFLGSRAGLACTRSTPLDQSLPNSDMRCAVGDAPCVKDTATGGDDCAAGTGPCTQRTDLDCDPRCDIGTNAGKACTTNAFCNPTSAQGATCAGTCQVDSTCVNSTTGADTGTPCTSTCVGPVSNPCGINGRYCSALSACTGCPSTTCTGTPCPSGTVCSSRYNEGDADFFALGAQPQNYKVFAAMQASAVNDYDFRMRITSNTETYEFDDDDGISLNGSFAPEIAGAKVYTAGDTYIKVSRSNPRVSEPYELAAIVRPQYPSGAQLESETGPVGNDIYWGWPGDVLNANYINNPISQGYVRGTFSSGGDSDCYKFIVHEGDLQDWFGDGAPARAAGAISTVNLPQPIIYDAEPAGISNYIFSPGVKVNTLPTAASPTLFGLTPAVPGSFIQWRAWYTGMLEVCYLDLSAYYAIGATAYPSPYAGSLGVNCNPLMASGKDTTTADVSVTKTGPVGPVQAGSFIVYTITVTNNSLGYNDIAQEVHLHDLLDPNVVFISLLIDDGMSGLTNTPPGTYVGAANNYSSNNTTCLTTDGYNYYAGLPTPGTNDTPIDCINTSMAPGSITTYTLTVQVRNCSGAGSISNTATIDTVSLDPTTSSVCPGTYNNPGTGGDPYSPGVVSCDSSTTGPTLTTDDGTCVDIVCDNDNSTCSPNNCTTPDNCNAQGECVGTAVDCDDHSVCTDDSCDPFLAPAAGTTNPCIHDSSQAGDLCDDFDPCTVNGCDPVNFCDFSQPTCDDGNVCTADSCNPDTGACTFAPLTNACCVDGQTRVCNDDNVCTDDSCDPASTNASGCVFTNNTSACVNANLCTTGDTCVDGACVDGTGTLNCDDGDCCTIDTCIPATGCHYEPNTTPPVISNPGCVSLWPPQHGYVTFTIADTGITATSGCGIASIAFGTCSSSQEENGTGVGDGNSTRDIVCSPGTVCMRAERDGFCSPLGREYTTQVVATDTCGNTSTTSFEVGVWHDRRIHPSGPYLSANPGSNQNDYCAGVNGTYPAPGSKECGPGDCKGGGVASDTSDADPEMEILQYASISVGNLGLEKASGGNVKLTWTEPSHEAGINVTRFHVYRLDPVTLFWTQIAEVTKQTTSWLDPVLNDGLSHEYKVTALIK